jgi:DNA-binding CsgD family transcriptional regulator
LQPDMTGGWLGGAVRSDSFITDQFVDEIYEAAVLPEKWGPILDRLAEIANAEGTLLFAAGPGIPRWLASTAIESTIAEWTQSRWFLDNPRGQRLVPINEPRFLTDFDALTIEEIDASDYYTELLRPRGLGWCVGTSIRSPSGDTLVFSIEKAHIKGPVPRAVAEQLDGLRPHLARAALLSGRLGLDRIKTAVTTLDLIGLPAAGLTATGRVISANKRFLACAGISVGPGNIVQFENKPAQALLMEAISNVSNSQIGFGRSIPVGGTKSEPPFVAHIVPLRGAGLDVFTGALSIVFITSVVPNSSPAPELLQALFDLTPAEARLASQLTTGKSIEQISLSSGLSPNTIRTHLKSVFSKTGVQRQAELVSLLGGTMNKKQNGTAVSP